MNNAPSSLLDFLASTIVAVMPTRLLSPLSLQHFGENLSVFGFFTFASVSRLLIDDDLEQTSLSMRWLLLPMLGSMAAAIVAVLLNPDPEKHKVIIGRGVVGVAFGTSIPKLVSLVHPWFHSLYLEPSAIFLSGLLIGLVFYVMAKPFVEAMYKRSGRVSRETLDRLEKKAFKDKQDQEPTDP